MSELGPEHFDEDAALVARCLDGDGEAWNTLVRRYRRLIYSIPVRLGLKPEQADEVFQDVCLKLLTRLDSLRDARSLLRWLSITTQRRCWDLVNHEKRYQEEPDSEQEAAATPAGDELLLEAEQAELVRQAVARLGESCRTLIEGLFFADPPLSYKELGKIMGRPHGSLGPTRLRCLKTLREQLEELGW